MIMNLKSSALGRFILVAFLLASTTIFLRARARREVLPPRQPLASFPANFPGWTSRDFPLDSSILEVLGSGEFLNRVYLRSEPTYVDLFIGFFPSQRAGSTIHSPKNCLPGSGWTPVSSNYVQLTYPGHAHATVNSYLVAKGMDRQVVLYWYQAHDRIIANEYVAKFYLVADAVRMNRTDGALVRIATPVMGNESVAAAQREATSFAEQILPSLDSYIPR